MSGGQIPIKDIEVEPLNEAIDNLVQHFFRDGMAIATVVRKYSLPDNLDEVPWPAQGDFTWVQASHDKKNVTIRNDPDPEEKENPQAFIAYRTFGYGYWCRTIDKIFSNAGLAWFSWEEYPAEEAVYIKSEFENRLARAIRGANHEEYPWAYYNLEQDISNSIKTVTISSPFEAPVPIKYWLATVFTDDTHFEMMKKYYAPSREAAWNQACKLAQGKEFMVRVFELAASEEEKDGNELY